MKFNVHRKHYRCNECNKNFATEGWYAKHMTKVHPESLEREPVKPKSERKEPAAAGYPPLDPAPKPKKVDFADMYGERAVAVVVSEINPRDPDSVDIAEVSPNDFESILSNVEREKRTKIRI